MRLHRFSLSLFLLVFVVFALLKSSANVYAHESSTSDQIRQATTLSQVVQVTIKLDGAVYLHYDDTSELDYADNTTWHPDVPDTFDPSRFSNFNFGKVGTGSCTWNSTKNQEECVGEIKQTHASYDYWYIPEIKNSTFTFKYGTGIQDRNVNLTLDLKYTSQLPRLQFEASSISPTQNEAQHLSWSENYNNIFDLDVTFKQDCTTIVTGICIVTNPGHSYVAVADLTNPDIKVELAHHFDDESTGQFVQKTVENFVYEDSEVGQNDNINHYYVAINGTGKSNNFPLENWGAVYSAGSILGINHKAYGSSCQDNSNCIDQPRASFFAYQTPPSIYRAKIDFPGKTDDLTTTAFIQNKNQNSSFMVGYRSSILDTIMPNGTLVPGFPAYVASDSAPDSDHPSDHKLTEEKTALGISADHNTLFLAVVDETSTTEQLARLLLAAGAARAILLDNGGSTQFYSFAQDESDRDYYALRAYYLWQPRNDINSIVVYNASAATDNKLIIPIFGGIFALSANIQITFSSNTFANPVTLTYTPQFPTTINEYRHVHRFYEIQAQYADGTQAQPGQPYTIQIAYDPASITPDVKEADLKLYFWNNTAWEVEPTSQLDLTNHSITATPAHFSKWAILAKPVAANQVFLPLVMK